MNEWAIVWTAVLAAGNLGVMLIVRPLLRTVSALERTVGANKATFQAMHARDEALRPKRS
jgi:hypothetical protein